MNIANSNKMIKVNKFACENIAELEETIANFNVASEKDKVNFGNLCIALKGFRMVAEATEALLINENILKGEDNNFYKKIEDTPPTTENVGSDFDIDKKAAQ